MNLQRLFNNLWQSHYFEEVVFRRLSFLMDAHIC